MLTLHASSQLSSTFKVGTGTSGLQGALVATILYLRVGTGTSGAPSVATILHRMGGYGYFGGVSLAQSGWVGTSHHFMSGLWLAHRKGALVATILHLRVGTGTSGAPSVATILHLMCGHGYFGGVFPAPTIWVGTSHHLMSGLWPSHQNVARRNYPPPSGGHGYFGQ